MGSVGCASLSLKRTMSLQEARKKQGREIVKKYSNGGKSDSYAAASDAIADILLAIAETEEEASQLLQSAEMDFRCALETASLADEG